MTTPAWTDQALSLREDSVALRVDGDRRNLAEDVRIHNTVERPNIEKAMVEGTRLLVEDLARFVVDLLADEEYSRGTFVDGWWDRVQGLAAALQDVPEGFEPAGENVSDLQRIT